MSSDTNAGRGAPWREQAGRRLWQAQGATNLEELHRLVRPLLLHRRKQHCLDLPPKLRCLVPVELDPDQALGFQHGLEQKVLDYRSRARLGLVRRDAEALAVLTALRQLGSHYKLPAARALVASLLRAGESVVVFTAFVGSAQLLQQQVDAFQRGDVPLLLATYGTGGLGFTLHRARHVVLLERPWTPGDAEQAEDRCHRIGMGAPLTCHWLQLGVADQLVDGLIANKAERIALVLHRREQQLRRQSLGAMVDDLLSRW